MRKRILARDATITAVGITETEMEGVRSGYGGDQKKEVEKVEEKVEKVEEKVEEVKKDKKVEEKKE